MFRYSDATYIETIKPNPSVLHALHIEDRGEEKKLTRGLCTLNGCVEHVCNIAALKEKPDIVFLFVGSYESRHQSVGYVTMCKILMFKGGYNFNTVISGNAMFPKLFAWPNNRFFTQQMIDRTVHMTMSKPANKGKSYEVITLPCALRFLVHDAYDKLCDIYDEVEAFHG